MATLLKQSTAVEIKLGPFVDNTDGFTAETALGIAQTDVRLAKNGGDWAQKNETTSATHEENGWYRVDLNTTDTDTLGILLVAVNESGALPVWREFMVVPAMVYDSLVSGSDTLQADITQFGGTNGTFASGRPEVNTTHWKGTTAATADTAGYPVVTIKDGTGQGELNIASGIVDANIEQWNTTAVPAEHTAGYPIVTIKDGTGTGELDTASGVVLAKDHAGANLATATALNTVDDFLDTEIADIQARLPAALVSGRIDASVGAIAANAITAASVASDAVTKLRSVVSGTSDSGTTTTMVDAARTEADTDHWKGSWILFTSGTISGQCRLISAFTPASDTITFAPATTQAVSTETYEILPAGAIDVRLWNGAGPNNLISGRVAAHTEVIADDAITANVIADGAVDGNTFAAGAITAAAIAADAITAAKIASDAITAAKIANGAIDAATFAAGAIDAAAIATDAIDADAIAANAIDAASIATGAITAAKFAAGAIDAAALATDAANEIRDVVWAKTMSELSAVPGVTAAIFEALEWLFLMSRNKITQTSTTQTLRNDADSANISTATVSDDGTTFTRAEWA